MNFLSNLPDEILTNHIFIYLPLEFIKNIFSVLSTCKTVDSLLSKTIISKIVYESDFMEQLFASSH